MSGQQKQRPSKRLKKMASKSKAGRSKNVGEYDSEETESEEDVQAEFSSLGDIAISPEVGSLDFGLDPANVLMDASLEKAAYDRLVTCALSATTTRVNPASGLWDSGHTHIHSHAHFSCVYLVIDLHALSNL